MGSWHSVQETLLYSIILSFLYSSPYLKIHTVPPYQYPNLKKASENFSIRKNREQVCQEEKQFQISMHKFREASNANQKLFPETMIIF